MTIDTVIKNRKTQKVLSDTPWDLSTDQTELHQMINDLLELASYAPFHKKCDEVHLSEELSSCLPWRFYVLDSRNCRLLLEHINTIDIKSGNIAKMLATADVLFLVTWLPEPSEIHSKHPESEAIPFEGDIKNMEHIAATATAIQNVLLGATALNIPNYWSSGGVLRNHELRDYLNIPLTQVMLGSLFLFPKDSEQRDSTIKLGQLRDQGKDKGTWSKHIQLAENKKS